MNADMRDYPNTPEQFEVRNNSFAMQKVGLPEVMFTIQVLAYPSYDEVDLEAAQRALTGAYAHAMHELSKRVEAARSDQSTRGATS